MRLSIGILAHNEADRIAATLTRLGAQTIFDRERQDALGLAEVELLVVPNGCSDATAAVATAALARFPATARTAVRSLAMPGKSNAWNAFVHDLSAPEATILALMDADIDLASDDVIELLLRRLAADPAVQVATDIPTKDYRATRRLSPFERLSKRVSAQREGGAGLCGQLYCGRAATLRRIWLPRALPVEDGFIAAMLITDGFTHPPAEGAIACVANARHYYEAPPGIAGFVRHEARIIVGSVVNAWLFTVLWEQGKNGHVGRYIADRNNADPDWVETVCDAERAGRGRILVPRVFLLWRLQPLRNQPLVRKLRRAPVALAATLATLPACIRANAILRGAAATRHW